jgi:hypothetical protein
MLRKVENLDWTGSPSRRGSELMKQAEGQSSTAAVNLRWSLVMGLLAWNLILFAMGSLAAALGGGLSDWGKGAGGLDGWADLSATIFSIGIGLPAAIATFREDRSILVAVGVVATGLLIGTGYLAGGHLVDPCDSRWWGFSTELGGTKLCSSNGDIAIRFHLLLHASPGVISSLVAVVIYRRRNLFAWWPPFDTAK